MIDLALAEQAGERAPDGMQPLLRWADWDATVTPLVGRGNGDSPRKAAQPVSAARLG